MKHCNKCGGVLKTFYDSDDEKFKTYHVKSKYSKGCKKKKKTKIDIEKYKELMKEYDIEINEEELELYEN